jgi:hypothetical protein
MVFVINTYACIQTQQYILYKLMLVMDV